MCVFMYIMFFTFKIFHSTNKLFPFSGFTVTYSQNTRVRLGSSVVLKFYRVKPLQTEDLKVEWRRKDTKTLVHLYQDGESQAQQDYQDRAHFFTDQIQQGNFSLRLDKLKKDDAGEYTCRVHSKQRSVFSTQFTLEKDFLYLNDSVLRLHLFLVVCPNMIMFFAFVFWGVSEGSVSETVCCCALYFLRPLLLLWAALYIKNRFSVQIKTWIQKYSYVAEYAVFSVVIYSALFASAWERFLNYAVFNKVMIIVLFAIVFVCCLCKITYILVTEVGKKSGRIVKIFDLVADMTFQILPTLQFILLFYTFGAARGGMIMIVVLPVVLMMMTNDRWLYKCRYGLG
ncbi:hypothetical protein cypCar_00038512, partial [Cyprinus carpio]